MKRLRPSSTRTDTLFPSTALFRSFVETDPATLKPLYGGLTRSEYVPSFSNVKYRLYNGTIDYDVGFATLTAATSYGEQLPSPRADYPSNLSAPPARPYSALLA